MLSLVIVLVSSHYEVLLCLLESDWAHGLIPFLRDSDVGHARELVVDQRLADIVSAGFRRSHVVAAEDSLLVEVRACPVPWFSILLRMSYLLIDGVFNLLLLLSHLDLLLYLHLVSNASVWCHFLLVIA